MGSVHSQKLERWFGTDSVEQISKAAQGWYGPPIGVSGTPAP